MRVVRSSFSFSRWVSGREFPKTTAQRTGIAFFFLSVCLPVAYLRADTIYFKSENRKPLDGVIDQRKSDDRFVYIRTPRSLVGIPRSIIDRIDVRENISPEEKRGDSLLNTGNLEGARDLYLEAYANDPDDPVIEDKIAQVKRRIDAREEKRYLNQFNDIDVFVSRDEFADAIALNEKLIAEAPTESARMRCEKKLAEISILEAQHYRNMVAYIDAERSYRAAIAAYPEGAAAQFELAKMLSASPANRREVFALYREGLDLAAKDPTLIERDALIEHRFEHAMLHLKDLQHRQAAELIWNVLEDDQENRFPSGYDAILRSIRNIWTALAPTTPENERTIEILEGIANYPQTSVGARYLLGRIACKRGRWRETVDYLGNLTGNNFSGLSSVDLGEARHCLALAYRVRGDLILAARELNALLEAQPNRFEALCELGEINYEKRNFKKAVELFLRAVQVQRTNYRGYVGAARSFRRLDRNLESLNQYRRLIDLRPNVIEYQFELGKVYSVLNKHEDAQKTYRRVIDLINRAVNPNSRANRRIMAEVLTLLGTTEVSLRNYYAAIEYYNKALGYDPNISKAYEGKGRAYQELSEFDKAEEAFRNAIRLDPTNPEYHLSLGVLFHKFKKDRANALPSYLKYYETGGRDRQVREWIRECGGTPPS